MVAIAILLTACARPAPTQVEIFSSWTTGPEAFGLQKLSDQFHADHPGAEVVNATLGPADTPADLAALRARMLKGDPPDSFQARMGRGFIDTWVASGQMQPLDELYRDNRLESVIPPSILAMVYYQAHPYSVPVNVHRANVLFYNKAVLAATGVDPASLNTFDGWLAGAKKLRAAGVAPLALGDSEAWPAAQLFETVLIGTLGPEAYQGLWDGETDWNGAGVTDALQIFHTMLGYVNPDHAALTWDQANQLVIDGQAAMMIMTDWADSDYVAKGFSGYGWRSPPGNDGALDIFGDAFGLPKGAKHAELTRGFLGVLASRQGQESFNKLQGALCARADCDYASFDAYFQSSAEALKTGTVVPSAVQGTAASESWSESFIQVAGAFVKNGDLAETQDALARACRNAGVCR